MLHGTIHRFNDEEFILIYFKGLIFNLFWKVLVKFSLFSIYLYRTMTLNITLSRHAIRKVIN